MPRHPAWLDEVRHNPYAEQLLAGFRRLRFSRALEKEYRQAQQRESLRLVRITLLVGGFLWLLFAVLDHALIGTVDRWWMTLVRVAVMGVLLASGAALLLRRRMELLEPLTQLCIGAMGVGAGLVVAIAHRVDQYFPYEGLMLISMAAFFLTGLRLRQALGVTAVVVLTYGLAEVWAGLPLPRLLNNLLFLLSGAFVGTIGCYLLEYKSREQFLTTRLIQLLADRDGLTGLYNRRSFDRQLQVLWRQAQRDGEQLSLLLVDVDHFKAFNDAYGHQAGDLALQQLARLLETRARRPFDMAVRLGGEEFAVLLYGTPSEEARQLGEGLREALQELAIAHRGSSTAAVLTLSAGLACLRPVEVPQLSQLYERADRALYLAKANGRNQLVCEA